MDISQHALKPEAVYEQTRRSIALFFRRYDNTNITREDCDRLAASILGGPVSPTLVQGDTSYTVIVSSSDQEARTKVVQFRPMEIGMGYHEFARLSYGEALVPDCKLRGTLGYVDAYVLDRVPGRAFRLVARQLLAPDGEQRLRRTVEDLARFFASAWRNGPKEKPRPRQLGVYYNTLGQVSLALGEEFRRKLDEIRQGLPLLFRPDYPTVVQHAELADANIYVDEATGRLDGVVDWADVNVVDAPFGVTLYGVEAVLGIQTPDSCHFHPRHVDLRYHFWQTLYAELGPISYDDQRSIEIAWMFGLLEHFGVFRKDFPYITAARRTFLKTLLLR